MCRDVDPDKVPAVYPNDDECIEKVETDRRDNEQVHGGNIWRMIAQEGSPSLTGGYPPSDHVLGDAGLRDLKPQLEQFAVDARRAPKWILNAHPPDQRAAVSRLVAALPFDTISNASSREIRLCANARASRAG